MNKRMDNLKGLIAQRRTRLHDARISGKVASPVSLQTMEVLFKGSTLEKPVDGKINEEPVEDTPVEVTEEPYVEETVEEIIADEVVPAVEQPTPVEEFEHENSVEEIPVEEPAPIEETPVEEIPVEDTLQETILEEQPEETPVEAVPDVYGSPIAVESHVEGTASFGGAPEGETSEVMPFEFGKPKRRNRRKNKEATNG